MPAHPYARPAGRLVEIELESGALAGNLLGDPAARSVAVYCSAGTEEGRWPLFVSLAGFTGSGLGQPAWKAFEESLPQRIDRLVATQRMGPVIVAMPDAFTRLGGNQYLNSAAMGRWGDYLVDDLLPAVEGAFPVLPGARAIFGKSSGGYGALTSAMRQPGTWNAVACHSGDMDFDLVYRPHLVPALDRLARALGRPLRDAADLDAATSAFVTSWEQATKVDGKDLHHLMTLAMAASYDPRTDAPFGARLPLDPWTGELDADAWERWRAHDPVKMVDDARCRDGLAALRGLWLDCGGRDQYQIHYGTRQLARKLAAYGVDCEHQEFDGDHSGVSWRLDHSLPWLYHRVTTWI